MSFSSRLFKTYVIIFSIPIDKYAIYYHYTDEDSLESIIESGKIRKSETRRGDAAYGEGVYLTMIDPLQSKEDILRNNYRKQRRSVKEKADAVIRIKIKCSAVEKCSNSRDVYLYPRTLRFESRNVETVNFYLIKDTRDGRVIKEVSR